MRNGTAFESWPSTPDMSRNAGLGLGSRLRRIGRPSCGKEMEIARRICAGLAAAQVLRTDFGLAVERP
ncbi:MAG: hypothetical protein JJE04_27145 [Acidobacteriia bacterium]|nr:hypothetical protein [Terriglobia bacterium]